MKPSTFVFIGQGRLGYEDLRRRATDAESCGYDGLWLVDHMWARGLPDADFLDGWTTIAALAEATQRLRLGVLVSCNSYRNPGLLAKSVVTIDHISNGRVEMGMGAGWMEEEYLAYGYEFPSIGRRLEELGEALEVIDSLLSKPRTDFAGKHYRFTDAPFEPKPLQQPMPMTLGGAGRNVMLRLVARHAHRWNCPMPAVGEIEELIGVLGNHCREIGRDPKEITISEQVAIVLGKDDAGYREKRELADSMIGCFVEDIDGMAVCGTANRVADVLAAKLEKGVQDFAILFGDLGMTDTLELFVSEVLPQLEIS